MQVEELVQKDVDFIRVQSKVKIEATHGTIFLQIHALWHTWEDGHPFRRLRRDSCLGQVEGEMSKDQRREMLMDPMLHIESTFVAVATVDSLCVTCVIVCVCVFLMFFAIPTGLGCMIQVPRG